MYFESYKQIAQSVKKLAKPNDIVMILGAGTIEKLAKLIVDKK